MDDEIKVLKCHSGASALEASSEEETFATLGKDSCAFWPARHINFTILIYKARA